MLFGSSVVLKTYFRIAGRRKPWW